MTVCTTARHKPPVSDLSHLARSGAKITIRVTPKASSNRVVAEEGGSLRVYVTAPPADGQANKAVIKLLSKVLGVPKSRIDLVQGAKSRDKVIHIM